jgi:hypothetical protein
VSPRIALRAGVTAQRGDTMHRLETRIGLLSYF